MSDEEYARWDAGNIRGIGRRRFVGVDKDEDGREINIYELPENDEWNSKADKARAVHLMLHGSMFDARCVYCRERQVNHG